MDTKSHDTPWGFTLEDAIEAFEFRRRVLEVEGMVKEERCVVALCEQSPERGRYCGHHATKLREIGNRRKLRERVRRLNETWDREMERVHEMLHWREVNEQFNWLREAREERKNPMKYRRARSGVKRKVTPYSGPPRLGYVYKLYDIENVLLYVGKTYSVQHRLFSAGGHASTKDWWPVVAEAEVMVYRTEAEAVEAEAHTIKREQPKLNRNLPIPKTKRAPRRIARYRGWVSSEPVEPLRC